MGKLICPDCGEELDSIEEIRSYKQYERVTYRWNGSAYEESHYFADDPENYENRFVCPYCEAELDEEDIDFE